MTPHRAPAQPKPTFSRSLLLIIGFGELAVLVWWGRLGLVGWVFWVGLVAVAGLVGGGVPVFGGSRRGWWPSR